MLKKALFYCCDTLIFNFKQKKKGMQIFVRESEQISRSAVRINPFYLIFKRKCLGVIFLFMSSHPRSPSKESSLNLGRPPAQILFKNKYICTLLNCFYKQKNPTTYKTGLTVSNK